MIQSSHHPVTILGIDPGLQRTGWGVIVSRQNQLSFVACGAIHSNAKLPMAERLKQLHDGLAGIITLYKPHEAAVEETFVSVNGASTLKLGQARGAIMLSLSLAQLQVAEYSATQVKKTVVGSGHADKHQIGMMVKTLLPKSTANQADAADALAVAICHAHHRTMLCHSRESGNPSTKKMDPRAFASPKWLRPRRRVKPEDDKRKEPA